MIVRGIAHVGMLVPDVEAVAVYYERVLGLERVGSNRLSARPDGAVLLADKELVLSPGEARLHYIAFEVDSFDEAPEGKLVDETLWVQAPGGWRFAFAKPVTGPPRRTGPAPFNLIRLGHVTLTSPAPKPAAAWCVQQLGFRISEQLGEEFYWLRCNRDHHAIAFSRGSRTGLHHVGFEVAGRDQLLRAADHFSAVGHRIEFGPGRHSSGGNLFVYSLDPWGLRTELFCELARIDDEAAYVPRVRTADPASSVNRWGPAPPESFYEHVL